MCDIQMADQEKDTPPPPDGDQGGGTATATAPAKTKPADKGKSKIKPKPNLPGMLPPWKVLLHNDDVNSGEFVVLTIMELTPLKEQDAILRMLEADQTGVALLLVTHKERAELYKDQFESKGLTVTIEPTEA